MELWEAIKKKENNQTIKALCMKNREEFMEMRDRKKCTLLHALVQTSNHLIANYLLTLYDELIQQYPMEYSKEGKSAWVNAPNKEGLSPFHYTILHNHYHLALLLSQHAADIHQVDDKGMTALHMAAKQNHPQLMYYCWEKGICLEAKDKKGYTALHWACYSGKQEAAYALVAWGCVLDGQEEEYKMTPLQLATFSGSFRIVRKLLLRGCDRQVRNCNGEKAIDVAKQNYYTQIEELIRDRQGIDELMKRKTPYRKVGKYSVHFFSFVLLFLSNYLLNLLFVVPSPYSGTVSGVLFLLMGLMVMVLYSVCCWSNPGRLKHSQTPPNYIHMLGKYKTNLCYDCKIVKPERCRHCEICGTCVSVYDHHCPWMGNCIGSHNYCYFFTFLLMMLLFSLFCVGYEAGSIVSMQVDLMPRDEQMENVGVAGVICSVYTFICSALSVLFIIYLLLEQVRNMREGKTTFQRSNTKHPTNRRGDSDEQEALHSNLMQKQIPPTSTKTLLQNCIQMCWGNKTNIKYERCI